MQSHDEVVSSWLNGSELAQGFENPAGPLFLHGPPAVSHSPAFTSVTTSSCIQRGCECC